MKVICDGLDLSDGVLKVSKALSVKSANPVLEGIKLVAKGDTLTLTATDNELTIEKIIKADVLMEGETVVVGKYFVDFTRKLEKEQVELSRLYDGGLQIKYSDSESELQVYPAESFPLIKKEEQENYFELGQKDFKTLVERITLACSTDDSRPILKGCLFEIKDGVLTGVALDGFRMSVVKKEITASGDFSAIIPARTIASRIWMSAESISVEGIFSELAPEPNTASAAAFAFSASACSVLFLVEKWFTINKITKGTKIMSHTNQSAPELLRLSEVLSSKFNNIIISFCISANI